MTEDVLRQLQREQKPWAEHNFGERPSWQPLLGAVEEIGELAHSHLKQEQQIRMTEDHDAKAKDAVGDVIIYLSDYCNVRGWDIADIVRDTWAQVRNRNWKANPNSAHVGNGDIDWSKRIHEVVQEWELPLGVVGQAAQMTDPVQRLREVVLTFTDGFMDRGNGGVILRRVPEKVARELLAHVESMRKAAKETE